MARAVVNNLKQKFGADIQVDLLLKNNDGSIKVYFNDINRIDNHVPEKYSRAQLEASII